MRVTFKLMLGILAGVGITLGVNMMLRAAREAELLESDIEKDHLVLGRALSVDILEEWRDRGRPAALELVGKMNAERDYITISAEEAERLAPAEQAALRAAGRLQKIEGEGAEEHLVTLVPLVLRGQLVAALKLDESLVSARAYVRSTMERTAISALVGLLASAALAWGFGFVIIGRPIRMLVEKARRVGAGDFSGPLPTDRSDELGLLAGELNAMCQRLDAARQDLERATNARVEALQQLRHADRLSTVGLLSAGIAHELGTPLNVVAGRARLIAERTEAAQPELARDARIIQEQAERMTRIARQLLDFARAGRPNRADVEIGGLARGTAELLTALAQKQGVELVVDADVPVVARIDAAQIQQALTNLIMNAVHASGRGQSVQLAVRTPARIEVIDRGSGMDEQTVNNLFVPFFTTKDVGEGTGLGLAVAWGLVQENGGHIRVISTKGAGSTFTIDLAPEAA
jgi:signal transduction histidine kinase